MTCNDLVGGMGAFETVVVICSELVDDTDSWVVVGMHIVRCGVIRHNGGN